MKTLNKFFLFNIFASLILSKCFKTNCYLIFFIFLTLYGCFILFNSFLTALNIKDADIEKDVKFLKRKIEKYSK